MPFQDPRPWYRVRWSLVVAVLLTFIGAAFIHHEINRPIEITVNSGPVGQSKTLKERMIFLVSIERAFHKKGWLASFGLEGEDGKTITAHWERFNKEFARQIAESQDIVTNLREMGFKQLIMRNGKQDWNINLRN